ncbi:selenide, water dikinase SelD [bacterium E08(2017)]|nr:selenide, water dikinase SelD [bacterium E08(2017)]
MFLEKDVCQCAGERVPPEVEGEVKLTDFVRSAGCASKIGQKDLHKVLDMLPVMDDPRLIVGTATADDAGVFELTPEVAVVQTVDVFTPGVDEPRLFGRIAACNSLSDIYAMGGKPVTALSIIGFPIYNLPHEVMAEIINGGIDVMKEADTILLGGHSINDEEIKFGLAVTGLIDKKSIIANDGAQKGDALILTKPLGTGIISLAHQIGRASEESVKEMTDSMATLNRSASEIMVANGATACTDVTGFGLLGHLCHIVRESHVTAEIEFSKLPLLPSVMEYAEAGMFSGANERNADFCGQYSDFDEDVSREMKAVLFDAQTSGGLLFSLPEVNAEKALEELQQQGNSAAAIVGRVTDSADEKILVRK